MAAACHMARPGRLLVDSSSHHEWRHAQIVGTAVPVLAVRAAVVRVRWMDQVTVRMLPGIGRQNRPAE